MNVPTFAPPVQASLQALLELVDTDRERQCAQVLGEAQARAAALRSQAHAEARKRMRQTFVEQRRALQAQVAAAQARLATQQRLQAQQRTSLLLGLARQQLPAALQARWSQPAARAAWVARVLDVAHARLPAAGWRIVHACDWPAEELATAAAGLAQRGHADPAFEADAAIAAGLKVVASGNVVDGSLAGLLAEADEIDAALLRLLENPS
ncbi:MAG: hypothetical protein Q7U73_07245 [Rubrivivax sp.]|nr:hypothetical protein [Rubrivivax sp.]